MAKEVKENQEVMSPRDKVRGRLASRFPDRTFMGEDGTDDTDAIDSSIDEMMSEYETREAEYNEQSKKLTDLFASDPRAAQAFMAWANGGPTKFTESLIMEFGDEFFDAFQSEEGRAKFIDAQKAWLDKRSAAEKADKEAEENFAKSVEDLKAFQAEHGLTDEEAIEVFDMVQKIGKDMVMGIYAPESLLMAYKAMKHDKDVSDARTEGEIAGRNTRIKEKIKTGDNLPPLPPSLGGQGGSATPARPASKKRTALDMFGIGE
jgi:hypothetical protein